MRKIFYIIICLLCLSSCYLPTQTFVAGEISYEKTPAVLIKKSIQDLNLVENLNSHLSINDNIIIASMEKYETLDSAIIIALEDEIIKDFVSNGYTILERDHHTLKWLNNELNYYGFNDHNNSLNQHMVVNTAGDPELKKSQLTPGDKVVSYRIIESGIIYKEDPLDPLMLEREARTILELRVLNIKTGAILDAINLDGVANDKIRKQDFSELNNLSYKHYSPTLPNTYNTNGEEIIIEKEKSENHLQKTKKRGTSFGQLMLVAVGWTLALIAIF